MKQGLKGLLSCLGFFKKWGKLNKVIYINNWLLSTNFYESLPRVQVKDIVSFLSLTFPKHTLSFRSVPSFFE